MPKKYIVEAKNGISINQRGQKLSDKLFKNNIQSIIASHDVEGILLSTLANSAMHHLRDRRGLNLFITMKLQKTFSYIANLKITPIPYSNKWGADFIKTAKIGGIQNSSFQKLVKIAIPA